MENEKPDQEPLDPREKFRERTRIRNGDLGALANPELPEGYRFRVPSGFVAHALGDGQYTVVGADVSLVREESIQENTSESGSHIAARCCTALGMVFSTIGLGGGGLLIFVGPIFVSQHVFWTIVLFGVAFMIMGSVLKRSSAN